MNCRKLRNYFWIWLRVWRRNRKWCGTPRGSMRFEGIGVCCFHFIYTTSYFQVLRTILSHWNPISNSMIGIFCSALTHQKGFWSTSEYFLNSNLLEITWSHFDLFLAGYKPLFNSSTLPYFVVLFYFVSAFLPSFCLQIWILQPRLHSLTVTYDIIFLRLCNVFLAFDLWS